MANLKKHGQLDDLSIVQPLSFIALGLGATGYPSYQSNDEGYQIRQEHFGSHYLRGKCPKQTGYSKKRQPFTNADYHAGVIPA